MPNGLAEARQEPTGYTIVTGVNDNTTTGCAWAKDSYGWGDNLAKAHHILRLQTNVFANWTGSTTSVTSGTADWPTGWLDTGTSACTTNTITFSTGNTDAANAVWGLDCWQNSKHSKVRWTPSVYKQIPKTAEELAAEAAQREIRRQKQIRDGARRKRFKEAANGRARGLLMQMLNETQREELEKDNHFHLTVHSRDGSMKVYRIDYGYAGNVKLIGADGKPTKRYCIHADSRLPYEDQMLAQKLLLEADEKKFLRIANMSRCRAA